MLLHSQWIYFSPIDDPSLPIVVECWDWDLLSSDDPMGTFNVLLKEIGPGAYCFFFCFTLRLDSLTIVRKLCPKKKENVSGTLEIGFAYTTPEVECYHFSKYNIVLQQATASFVMAQKQAGVLLNFFTCHDYLLLRLLLSVGTLNSFISLFFFLVEKFIFSFSFCNS